MEETELGETMAGDAEATGRMPARREPVGLGRGDALGRYVVLDVLGAGGMGIVYAAYDPELGRRVAIKLLHPALDASLDESMGRARLLREAQALAQLQHPNVVTVHDVGQHAGQVFVAMEHIQGFTLRAWLERDRRGWREVLTVLVQAGRGLAAAHAKGMVHRDFKPDNVMLELDGDHGVQRVLVMDFGLAASTEVASRSLSGGRALEAVPLASFTRTGAVMGTPAYMAPEQHRGQPTDERTDQLNFCVTLYEALYGERPFAGETLPELVLACTTGTIAPAPRGSSVPRWLREVVVRGLAVEPDRRWPSMTALLAALQHDPTRARRRWIGAAIVLGTVGLAYGSTVVVERRRLAECRTAADAIDEVWNDGARARVRDGLLGTEVSYAAATWERLEPRIDERAEQWRTLRHDTCADPSTIPAALITVQDECFEASRAALADEIDVLAEATPTVVSHAIQAVLGRGRPSTCLDVAELGHRTPLPTEPDARARVEDLERRIERASLLEQAGRYDDARALARECVEDAQELDQRRLRASALAVEAFATHGKNELVDAEQRYEEAYFAALAAHHDSLVATMSSQLGGLVGHDLARPVEGRRWIRHAEVFAGQADLGEVARAAIVVQLGLVELAAGEYATARDRFEQALATYERELGRGSLRALRVLGALAIVHDRLGEPDLAIGVLTEVLEGRIEALGPRHPDTARAHNDLAAALLGSRDFEQAELHLRQAIELYEAEGIQSSLGAPLDNLALVLREAGRFDEALETSERAVRVRRATRPEGHPDMGNALINRGQIHQMLGKRPEAIADIEAALEIYERSLGPDHSRVGDGAYVLAKVLGEAGDHERSLELHRKGLRARIASLPATHPNVAWSLMGVALAAAMLPRWSVVVEEVLPRVEASAVVDALPPVTQSGLWLLVGRSLLETGRPAEALAWLRKARTQLYAPEQDDVNRAVIELTLARAQWAVDEDRPGAIELARSARRRLAALETAPPGLVAEVEAWLAAPS